MTEASDTSRLFGADPDLIEVGIGDLVVADAPKRLLTPALGSCVGLSLYDPIAKRGGLAHIMLPSPSSHSTDIRPGRFADLAVPELLGMLARAGSPPRNLRAKIAGGAAMFRGDAAVVSIGDRNVEEVRRQLGLASVPIVAQDVGEAHARTIELLLDDGILLVRSYQFGVQRI